MNTILEFLSSFIVNYGYLNLFVLSFLASTILPLGSEPLVVALVYKGFNPVTVVMVATLGNYLDHAQLTILDLRGDQCLRSIFLHLMKSLRKVKDFLKNMAFTPFFLPGCRG